MKKPTRIQLKIDDDTRTQRIELKLAGTELLRIIGPSIPVRIRSPLPNIEMLRGNTKAMAESRQTTHEHELTFYIHCREREIEDNILDILKSMKRIIRQLECIQIAQGLVAELNN